MEMTQLHLQPSEVDKLTALVDKECTSVAGVREALETQIDMYEQEILGTPLNSDGSDIIIPNFLMTGYKELQNQYSSLLTAIDKTLDENVKNSHNQNRSKR